MRKNIFKALFTVMLAFAMVFSLSALTACQGGEEVSSEPKFEIALESNGGTQYYNVLALAGDSIVLPSPEREGYQFIGWYDNAKCEGEQIVGEYLVSADATLYAKWDANEGTIKFESNGGTQYNDLQFVAQRVELPTPKKEGYIFSGWYASENFEGEALSSSIVPTGDMTVYAMWETIIGSVVFESNGGTQYARVDTAGQKVQLPVPTKEGYLFAGWYDNANFDGSAYEGEFLPEETVTLYARWATTYTLVALEENGGAQLKDVKLFDNDNLVLPEATRWGYRFLGWYDNAELTGVPVDDYYYYPTSDVTLYAKWEKCSYLYLFYGPTKMEWTRFEYDEGDVISLEELYALLTPEDITIVDFLGNEHTAPFKHWSYQGYDEKSHVQVTSDVVIEDDYLILVAQYDDSSVPPAEYLTYDKETDVYTTTGKVAHVFIEDTESVPYVYSLDLSFRKGISGAVGPTFRTRVSDADYHYEGGCDYLSPVISPSSGSFYIASVLNGSWSYFVNTIAITNLPKSWQDKFMSTEPSATINVTISIVDYGTWFEVYIDNDLAYTYTNSTKLASYPYSGLGVRSSSTPAKLSNATVSYGYEVSYETGVEGLTVDSDLWLCGDIELPVLTRDNYALAGWYFDEELTQVADNSNFYITSDVTLYAKWSNEYNVVSFNTNGGSACASVNYASGKLYLPETTKMNYIFTGWYKDAGLTQLVDEYNFEIDADTTLYAGWRLPYSHLTKNADGSYNYNKKTEAVLGTLDSGIPASGTYHEFSQTITMTKGAGSVGIAFRMNMNKDYTYETAGTDYISIQFCTNFFRVSYVQNGAWRRLLPNNADYGYDKMPQSWKDKCDATADGAQMTVTLTVRDYGSYFEAYIDGVLAYTYGENGETVDLTQFTGNGYGIRCSSSTPVIFKNVTAEVVQIIKEG